MSSENVTITEIERAVDQTLDWSRARDYRGYNKHDGLNSPILRALLGWGRWPRMIAIQGVMRFPVNLRPLLLVPRTLNPKGLALFTQGLLDRYQTTGDVRYLDEARQLLDRLYQIRSPGQWQGDCWGYHYPWQDPGFHAPTNTPNAVVTCFVCEAFLDAWQHTGEARYLDTVGSAIGFLLNDLSILKDEDDELCLSYMPMPMSMRVMDVSILIGSVIARHAKYSCNPKNLDTAFRLVNYVVNRQTDEGAWFYTDPPGDSHIRHDNYHTGFILDALARYMDAAGKYMSDWPERYSMGLDFYATRLFNDDGSPRWMSDQDYPHDIHGAAQGILTFSRHAQAHAGLLQNIVGWTMNRMYHPKGRFYYQECRGYRKTFTLMRWCNAWMVRALSAWLRHTSEEQ